MITFSARLAEKGKRVEQTLLIGMLFSPALFDINMFMADPYNTIYTGMEGCFVRTIFESSREDANEARVISVDVSPPCLRPALLFSLRQIQKKARSYRSA